MNTSFIWSLLYSKRVSHHRLCLAETEKAGRAVRKLQWKEMEGFRFAAIGGCGQCRRWRWANLEGGGILSDWLGEHMRLSLVGCKLEVEAKLWEAGTY